MFSLPGYRRGEATAGRARGRDALAVPPARRVPLRGGAQHEQQGGTHPPWARSRSQQAVANQNGRFRGGSCAKPGESSSGHSRACRGSNGRAGERGGRPPATGVRAYHVLDSFISDYFLRWPRVWRNEQCRIELEAVDEAASCHAEQSSKVVIALKKQKLVSGFYNQGSFIDNHTAWAC